nr:glycoside hydrolase family 31 protein [uncultured Butyrivibrio sp.]
MITGDNYRITVLTDRLVRFEYSKTGVFEDRKSFMVVNRDFPDISLSVQDGGDSLLIDTGALLISYDKEPFSSYGLIVEIKETGKKWNFGELYGDFSNLGGTARTLDDADGRVPLEKGIFGKNGYSVLDDSKSPVYEKGEFVSRTGDNIDIYFFGYGTDYYAGLRDFTRLCGKIPMIPRYALGNWWSRYYRYSEDSYMEVVNNFAKEKIPLSVAVIDMDWHVTEVDPKYGSGWTGYSWNKDLFPDYRRFLKKLHENGLSVTLNLHPADGIRAFEDMYEDVAKELSIDPESGKPCEFDFGDKKYRNAYFKKVMHPYEEDGVDFWWIDWQQGTGKKKDDVDPLLLLNHYHYKDLEKRNKRPMIFSRYAGPGSHRYPVGFSGDSHTTWKSLDFQPFFTSTASNIAFGTWSHDIGGHMLGDKDLDRLIRWIEFGVFSPIMRIHSSCSPFFNKEPWLLPEPYRSIVRDFMQLRHALIPYIYTENHRAYEESKPLIRPMYYDYQDSPESYEVRNQYGFGENLLVCAVTRPQDEELRLGSVRALIPKGRWYDIFTGVIYKGERLQKLYRELSQIPVLLPEGGIVPLKAGDLTKNTTDNPADLKVLIGGGKSGSYTLYEDDGSSMDFEKGVFAETEISFEHDLENKTISLRILKARGDTSLIPAKRNYRFEIYGVRAEGFSFYKGRTIVEVSGADVNSDTVFELKNVYLLQNDYKALVFEILERAWIATTDKEMVYDKLNNLSRDAFYDWIYTADLSESLKNAIMEFIK